MTGLAKLLGAAAVAGVGLVCTLIPDEKPQESHPEIPLGLKIISGEVKPKDLEDTSFVEKIKRYVKKMVAKFFVFVVENMEKIEATSTVIGLASAAFGIMSAVRDWRKGNDTQEKLDELNRKIDKLTETYSKNTQIKNGNQDLLFDDLQKIMHNQGVIYDTIVEVKGETA